jgi:hypothetical protein
MTRLRLSGAKGWSLTTCFLGSWSRSVVALADSRARARKHCPSSLGSCTRAWYDDHIVKGDRYASSHELREFHTGS